jgi:hypothetical protein
MTHIKNYWVNPLQISMQCVIDQKYLQVIWTRDDDCNIWRAKPGGKTRAKALGFGPEKMSGPTLGPVENRVGLGPGRA